MERFRYQLADGTRVPQRAVNNHHAVFERNWYLLPAERLYRNLTGLVLPMYIPFHNDLHATVEPPIKPSKGLREQITEFAHYEYGGDPYEEFDRITDFVGDIANTSWSAERAQEAWLLQDNFKRQRPFVEMGRVVVIGAEVA